MAGSRQIGKRVCELLRMPERAHFFHITAVEDRMPIEERRKERHACFVACSISLLVNCDVTERSLDCPVNFGANWIVRSPSTMRDAVLRPADSGGGNWISAGTAAITKIRREGDALSKQPTPPQTSEGQTRRAGSLNSGSNVARRRMPTRRHFRSACRDGIK